MVGKEAMSRTGRASKKKGAGQDDGVGRKEQGLDGRVRRKEQGRMV